jgi:hypothetical protein
MMKRLLLGLTVLMWPVGLYAQSVSHNYVNTTRSSFKTRIFVSQGVEGEYGDFLADGKKAQDGGQLAQSTGGGGSRSKWQGYNFTSTIGIETMKFIQFHGSHSAVNMRSAKTSLEHIQGSRLSGGMRLVFLAPVANLEVGGGVIGTRYDYQKDLETSDFYGSGIYYSLGMNYFMTDQVSFFTTGKLISEHSVKGGGNADLETLTANTTNLGLGFSLWL